MTPLESIANKTRREFLTTSASGLGGMALGSMLAQEGVLNAATAVDGDQFRELNSHKNPKAKACIFIYMAGAPSQLDLFENKPKLNELDGSSLPKEILDKARFAFIKPETAKLMGVASNVEKTR